MRKTTKNPGEKIVKDIKRATRRHCSSEEKIRIVLDGLYGEIFYSLREAQIIIESGRKHYNTKRPHSALGYRPPAPEAIAPMDQRPIMHQLSNWTTQMGLLSRAG